MDDSYRKLFVPSLDFSYRCENFSFFHIFKQSIEGTWPDDDDDDADAYDDDDDAKPKTTTPPRRRRQRRCRRRRRRRRRCHTNIYNNIYVAVSICRRFGFLVLFLTPFSFVAVEFLRRYEKSEDGTKSPWYERYEKSKNGTKSPWYESSMARKVHKWYETSMVRKVWFPSAEEFLSIRYTKICWWSPA